MTYALIDGNMIAAAIGRGYGKFLTRTDNRLSVYLSRNAEGAREKKFNTLIVRGDGLSRRAETILREQGDLPEALVEAKSAYAAALANYSSALKIATDVPMPRAKYAGCAVNLGKVCFKLGQRDEAREIVQTASDRVGMERLDRGNEFDKATADALETARKLVNRCAKH